MYSYKKCNAFDTFRNTVEEQQCRPQIMQKGLGSRVRGKGFRAVGLGVSGHGVRALGLRNLVSGLGARG